MKRWFEWANSKLKNHLESFEGSSLQSLGEQPNSIIVKSTHKFKNLFRNNHLQLLID